MRTMMMVSMGVEAANRAAKDGRLGKVVMATQEKLKPEASYFTAINGKRTAFFVFDMTDSSQMPVIAEQLFQEMDAEIHMTPVMNTEDLKKGLAAAGMK